MADLRICRICLTSGVKMYEYDRYYLKQYYEEVMAVKIYHEDPLPHKFCYECAAMLYKFHKFKEKCWIGQAVLQRMLSNGPITLKSVSKVDRQSNNLNSSIDIVNSTSRVKTCRKNYVEKIAGPNIEIAELPEMVEIPEIVATPEIVEIPERVEIPEKDEIPEIVEIPEITDISETAYVKSVIPDIQIPETTEISETADVLETVDIKMDSDDSLDINLADYKNEPLEKENVLEVMVNREVAKLEMDIETIDNDTDKLDNDMITDIYDDRIASEDEKSNEIENGDNDNIIKDETKDSILENPLSETKEENTKSQSKTAKSNEIENGDYDNIIKDETKDSILENPLSETKENNTKSRSKTAKSSEIENGDNDNIIKDNTKGSILKSVLSKKKKKKDTKKQSKAAEKRRFEVEYTHTEKNDLDPKHWLKVNLSEEEAVEEFNARAHNPKYVQAAFNCTNCYKGFSREDMLTRHLRSRHTESVGRESCRFCNMRFKWNHRMIKHIAQHFTRYKCLRCDLVCDLKTTALFHNDYHNGVIRKCKHCGQEFNHPSTYYTHLRTHRSTHVCAHCGVSFVSAVGLAIHARNMHLHALISPEEAVNIYCDKCDIKFVTHKAYEEHIYHSAKHGDAADTAGDVDPSNASFKLDSRLNPKGVKRKPRKQTLCQVCDKIFSSYAAFLKHHQVEHEGGEERRTRKMNGASLGKRPVNKQKRDSLGSKEERVVCEICGVSLKVTSMWSHRNTHAPSKLFSCDTCGLKFNTKISVTRHQLVHTGEKPYECELCDKRFTQLGSLKLHFRTAHLKQPYPKRNRKKKIPDAEDIFGETFRNSKGR